eukprot:2843959-Rhodomonas_salina.1
MAERGHEGNTGRDPAIGVRSPASHDTQSDPADQHRTKSSRHGASRAGGAAPATALGRLVTLLPLGAPLTFPPTQWLEGRSRRVGTKTGQVLPKFSYTTARADVKDVRNT